MKIELDGDTIRLNNRAVAFVRANASAIDLTRLREIFDRANTVSSSGVASKLLSEFQTRLEAIVTEIGVQE